ncbi:MAG: FliM/FliN family flagellar motor switch protein [Bacteroidales bacterium]|nr:FliM/FliN family flagellar motor switch protein [Candidatus Latescibacterota bacterium]
MSRLLSQAEANDLIGSIQTGTIDLEPFNLGSIIDSVSYDFTKPHSLSRSFTNNLATISDGFSKAASMTLSTYLRASITVTPLEPRHILFQEFVNDAGNPACLGIVNLNPLRGQSVLEIEAPIIFSLVDKLMGGSGETLDQQRGFTEIEIRVATRVMEKLLADFAAGSKRFIDMRPAVSRIEHNPEYVNICASSERVVTLDFEINMGQFTGMIHFGIPISSFESVIELLDPVDEQPERSPEERQQDVEILKDTLRRVSLGVRVDIGETRIPISKVRNLREGDVVVLDNRVTDPVDIVIEGKRKFKGIPGLVNGKKAVRWTSVNIEGGGGGD